MKFIKYIMVIVILLIIACDMTSPERFKEDLLVIAGYLQAGQPVSIDNPIFIGKTTSVDGGNFLDVFLDNALVTIENIGNAEKDTLYFGIYQYKIGYYNDDLIIKSGNTYKIEVEAVIDSVPVYAYALTTVPDSIYLDLDYYDLATPEYGFTEENSAILPQIPFDEIEDNFPVYSRYDNGNVVYTYYHYYCLEEFSTNLEFTQPFMDYTHLEEEDEDAYNSPLSNNMRESSSIWRYQPEQDSEGKWYLLERTFDGGFVYYAPYRLTIYSVDQNFYTYKYHSESYFYGGIQGGIGYFGSVAGKEFYTNIVK